MHETTVQQSSARHLKLSEAIRVVEKSGVSPIITSEATSTWNKFKDSVLQDEKVFDDFLDVVYRGQYQQYECSYGNLLIYRTLLAVSFIESAKSMYGTSYERKSHLAQKAFLVSFAARSTFPSLFDSSNEGVSLESDVRKMMSNDAFDKESSLDRQKRIDQMKASYSYAKRHHKQLANILWRYFFEHQMVKNWTPH